MIYLVWKGWKITNIDFGLPFTNSHDVGAMMLGAWKPRLADATGTCPGHIVVRQLDSDTGLTCLQSSGFSCCCCLSEHPGTWGPSPPGLDTCKPLTGLAQCHRRPAQPSRQSTYPI